MHARLRRRRPASSARRSTVTRAPNRRSTSSSAVRRRVEPDVVRSRRENQAARRRRPARTPRRRNRPAPTSGAPGEPLSAAAPTRSVRRRRPAPPNAAQRTLGVIAGRRRLDDATSCPPHADRRAGRRSSTWALGTSGRCAIARSCAPRIVSGGRPSRRLDARAHALERLDHAAHRAARQRRVADHRRREAADLPGFPPGAAWSSPSCRHRAATSGELRRPKPRPSRVTEPAGPSLMSTPSCAQARERRAAIRARSESG